MYIFFAFAACVDDTKECTKAGECQPDSYQGTKNTTVVGIPCQAWSSDTPHESEDKEVGDHNNCRNPSGDYDFNGPWCYTSDPEQEWAYCFSQCSGKWIPLLFVFNLKNPSSILNKGICGFANPKLFFSKQPMQ